MENFLCQREQLLLRCSLHGLMIKAICRFYRLQQDGRLTDSAPARNIAEGPLTQPATDLVGLSFTVLEYPVGRHAHNDAVTTLCMLRIMCVPYVASSFFT